jgi:hypothetical protein
MWVVANTTLLAIYIGLILWQRYTIGKKIILGNVLLEFKRMRYETTEILVNRILVKKGNSYENKELYDFLLLTTKTIDHFEVLRNGMSNFRWFVKIFMTIDILHKQANEIDLETSELVHKYKARFVRNLLYAFKTVPFFRFRILAVILNGFSRISIGSGVKRVSGSLDKIRYVRETYKLIKAENRNLAYLI